MKIPDRFCPDRDWFEPVAVEVWQTSNDKMKIEITRAANVGAGRSLVLGPIERSELGYVLHEHCIEDETVIRFHDHRYCGTTTCDTNNDRIQTFTAHGGKEDNK